MGHSSHQGDVAHEEVVDGVKVTFKAADTEMPKGMKENSPISQLSSRMPKPVKHFPMEKSGQGSESGKD